MLYLMNALNFCKSQLAGLVGIDSSCKIACRNGDKKGIHGQVLRCVPFTVLQNYCDFHLQNRIRGGGGVYACAVDFLFSFYASCETLPCNAIICNWDI